MTKYDEVMEKLEVTPEMRARILRNVEAQAAQPSKKPNRLRRFAALAACLAILLVGAAALPKLISSPTPEESETTIANGMVEVASKEELSEAVGFPVKSAQSLPFFPQSIYYTSYWGEMAQIDYANGGSMACFRQSLGEEDNSGDWSEYPAKESFTVNGCAVTLKGERDSYTLAIWQDGTYSYSLSLSAGQPASVWAELIEGVR